MLKVECESCKAPYQVDERRVPPTGLKMRCPKCGHAFTVTNPDAKVVPPPVSKHTIMGVAAPPAAPAPPGPGALSIDDDLLPQLPAPKPAAPKAAAKPAAKAPVIPAPLGDIDELMDLPAMPDPGLPAAKVRPLPTVKPTLVSSTGNQPPAPAAPAKPPAPSLADYDIDLPSNAADLPATRGPAKPPKKPAPKAPPPPPAKAPTVGGALTFEVDLPAAAEAYDLPTAKPGAVKSKQPPPMNDLPATRDVDLPAAFGDIGLPAAFGDIGLPSPAGGGGFGAIDLPALGASPGLPAPIQGSALPATVDQDRYLPRAAGAGAHLPTAVSGAMHLPSVVDALPSALSDHNYLPAHQGGSQPPAGGGGGAFGEADFGDLGGGPGPSPGPGPAQAVPGGQGGVGFGELDFGASAGDPVGFEADAAPPAPLGNTGDEIALPTDDAKVKPRERVVISKNQGRIQKIAAGGLGVVIIAGALLQLTSYGAFGWHVISDSAHQSAWADEANQALGSARTTIGVDLYDKSRAAADALANAAAAQPRSLSLLAAAALVEYEFQIRYGRDAARATRADAWLKTITDAKSAPSSVRFYDAAAGARGAVQGDAASGRALLDAASQKDTGDPVQQDIALVRGELELTAGDAAAATTAFTRALGAAPSARAHYGLARAALLAGDKAKALTEITATLAATPNHPGALVLKARIDWDDTRNDAAVIDGLKPLLDGAAKVSASPAELARAYTVFGLAQMGRGDMGAARTAFESALKYDATSPDALIGQGEVFYADGRWTEALSRFDTAVQVDPKSAVAIVADAKAKLALERLADAKAQLAAAQKLMPKNMPITYWLGRVEEALGNKKGAEDAYAAAVTLVGPKDHDAILPYVALSTLLAHEGRATEAQAKLNDARAKLPDSSEMQRALGEVAAAQGLFDDAIAHYQAATTKDPHDLRARFLLGETFLRMRRLDEASAEFDKVAAADKDYPNLAVRRGELLEASGHIDKALEEFKAALEKAPNDLDLQLRVGAAYVGIGRGDEGYKVLKPVYDKRQSSAEVNHYIGRARLLQGGSNLIEAIRYLTKAVDVEPTRAEYHLYLAWAGIDSHNLKLGEDEVRKALALDQLLGDGYWLRAVIEEIQGAVDDSIRDAQKALELHPSRTEAHATLAKAYSDKNVTDKSLAEWAIATSRGSEHPEWEFLYGRMLYARGSFALALPQLKAAATAAEATEPSPEWMAEVEFMTAECLRKAGNKADAKEHYIRFLGKADLSSPDRKDALAALKVIAPDWHPE